MADVDERVPGDGPFGLPQSRSFWLCRRVARAQLIAWTRMLSQYALAGAEQCFTFTRLVAAPVGIAVTELIAPISATVSVAFRGPGRTDEPPIAQRSYGDIVRSEIRTGAVDENRVRGGPAGRPFRERRARAGGLVASGSLRPATGRLRDGRAGHVGDGEFAIASVQSARPTWSGARLLSRRFDRELGDRRTMKAVVCAGAEMVPASRLHRSRNRPGCFAWRPVARPCSQGW